MSLLDRYDLPRREGVKGNVPKRVGGAIWSPVEKICSKQTVSIGKLVVNSSSYKILVDDLLAGKSK
jgi:hypothetical protein